MPQPYRAGTPACIWQGNEYLYGRNYGGNCVPDAVCNVMEQNGFSVSRKKPSGVGTYTHRSWDYVITLCKEAGEELKFITLDAKQQVHFDFEDPFKIVFKMKVSRRNKLPHSMKPCTGGCMNFTAMN